MKRIIIVLAILGAILLSSSLYTVNETQVAIKLRLGEIVSVENKPGLKFKTPFVNNVVSFDKRIQTLDSAAESFLTVEKKNVVVDSSSNSMMYLPIDQLINTSKTPKSSSSTNSFQQTPSGSSNNQGVLRSRENR